MLSTPAVALQPPRSFKYVYLLVSEANPGQHYVGQTDDLRARLAKHNSGGVPSTVLARPWRIEVAVAFHSIDKAVAFERYLKSHSGRSFAKRHF
jgi:predicted GIY-YIG superfamily endonuclease